MSSIKRRFAIHFILGCSILTLIFVSVARPDDSRLTHRNRQLVPAGSPDRAKRQNVPPSEEEIKRHFPKVDYDAPEPTDPIERAKRREKGKHYNNGYISKKPTHYSSSLYSEWDVNVPAIPVQQSSAVVVGRTLSGGAFISADKTGVYTELSLKVEEVLQSDRDSLTNDGKIDVSRMGGVVRYHTGEESLFYIVGQNMPTIGKRYLLFLKAIPGTDDFQILTGYELSPSGVIALDNPAQFKKQNGGDVASFLQAVKSAVSKQKRSN